MTCLLPVLYGQVLGYHFRDYVTVQLGDSLAGFDKASSHVGEAMWQGPNGATGQGPVRNGGP